MNYSSASLKRGFYVVDKRLKGEGIGEHLCDVMYGNEDGHAEFMPAEHLAPLFQNRFGRDKEIYVGRFWLRQDEEQPDLLRFVAHDPVAGALNLRPTREEEIALRSEIVLMRNLVRQLPDFLVAHPENVDMLVKARLKGLGITPGKTYHVKEYLSILQENLEALGKSKK